MSRTSRRENYKVDIFSRNQVGRGNTNANGAAYAGSYADLDGIVSCPVVSDPDLLTKDFTDTGITKQTLIPAAEFWASGFTAGKPLPQNIEDLVILLSCMSAPSAILLRLLAPSPMQ